MHAICGFAGRSKEVGQQYDVRLLSFEELKEPAHRIAQDVNGGRAIRFSRSSAIPAMCSTDGRSTGPPLLRSSFSSRASSARTESSNSREIHWIATPVAHTVLSAHHADATRAAALAQEQLEFVPNGYGLARGE
jgi:hypothetical protein